MTLKKQLSLFAQGIEDFVFSKKNYYKYKKYYDYRWGYEQAALELGGHRWYFKNLEKQNENN
jgi:hypothetical protein|tara:strand:+ start:1701 stop:1886 length:186 start_codon:yes stop_codon:yes gene_type:complete